MTHGHTAHGARRAAFAGTGHYLPERVLSNADLERMVETSDEWIRTRTGIRERRIAAEGEVTSDMAAAAARRALESAGAAAEEVDAILVATCTPDHIFPNTACAVQQKIGATRAFCMDLSAACSGFLFGLETARGLIASGGCRTVLVIGAEKMSCVVDWQDRSTCVLFGDGAGAVVLREASGPHGILAAELGSDGSLGDLLKIPGGGSVAPASARTVAERLHYVKMGGNHVFRHAVTTMSEAGRKVLDKAGLSLKEVDWIVPHQANLRILHAIAERAEMPMERIVTNLERVGNLSAASIPVALDEAVRDGRVRPGQVLLLIAFGGGFTWGAMAVRW
jgi:3-oxoacyl-[acyl-carrier-protein] synthase-3